MRRSTRAWRARADPSDWRRARALPPNCSCSPRWLPVRSTRAASRAPNTTDATPPARSESARVNFPRQRPITDGMADADRIRTSFESQYTWRYEPSQPGLSELYEKAKREQWNATDQLAWETPVDPESEIIPAAFNPLEDYAPFRRCSAKEQAHVRHAMLAWQLSQFLHGEQGALMTASQLVSCVPWIEAKAYAATQAMDEARHVEVFSRYVREKLEWEFPINESLRQLLDAVLTDARWDLKYLGMQVLVEGLAMAAFGNLHQIADDPLLVELIHYVMRDEARHVAFGVLSLDGYYREMSAGELRDREDFIIEASL